MDTRSALSALATPPSPAMLAALEAIGLYTKTKNEVMQALERIKIDYRKPGSARDYRSHTHTVIISPPANDD